MAKTNAANFQKWLEKARHDLDAAILMDRDGGFTDTVCYFCHQTAEKSLKAYLLFHGILDFPHTHDLPSLINQCSKFVDKFSDLRSQTNALNKYYIESKYPQDLPVDYSKEEAKEALNSATEIYEFVRNTVE